MAFSFGSTAPAATPFGGGLFGAASAPAFGAASAPAFGASTAPAFGATSAPAFGATATPAFGAASAPAASPFGAAPAASPFGTAAPAFGATNLFGQPASAPATSNALVPAGGLFGGQAQQQQQAQQAQQARPGLNYKTKFEELPPQMQQELQRIQQEISSYRDECRALDSDERLHDTEGVRQSLDAETAALRQTLRSLYTAALADEEGLLAFRERVMVLLRSTESAIRLYQRSRLWRELSAAAGAASQPPGLLSSQAVQEALSAAVQLPNPFLGLAVRGFGEALEQYHRCISELERVLPAASQLGNYGAGTYGSTGASAYPADEASAVAGLPTLVSHMHDYFVHVAARLERLHGEVARARESYLAQRRTRGDFSDPFADARPLHHLPAHGGPSGNNLAGGGAGGPKPGGFGFGGAGGAGGGAASSFYSFGGPAVGGGGGAAGGGTMSGIIGGGAAGGASVFGGGVGSVPASPAPAAASAGSAPGGGGLFGLSPAPAASLFGAPAAAAGVPASPTPFGTPLFGAAAAAQAQQQAQAQRAGSSRVGSSSSKKR